MPGNCLFLIFSQILRFVITDIVPTGLKIVQPMWDTCQTFCLCENIMDNRIHNDIFMNKPYLPGKGWNPMSKITLSDTLGLVDVSRSKHHQDAVEGVISTEKNKQGKMDKKGL